MNIKTQHYFEAEGWLKLVLESIYSCQARNQMWQTGRRRRVKYLNKANIYLKKLISRHCKNTPFTHYNIERTGSDNLYDVADRKNQSFRIYLYTSKDTTHG